MITLALAIAVHFSLCTPPSPVEDKFAEDRELIARAAADRKATSQPVATIEEPKTNTVTAYRSDFDKEVREFRRDQVEVQEGWVSYPKDWRTRVAKREKHKDGVIFEGSSRIEEGKEKRVVIYNVNDLLLEVPDFKSQMFDDEECVEYDNRDDILWTGKANPKLTKKEKRSAKAKELEKLIKEMLRDDEKVKIVDP